MQMQLKIRECRPAILQCRLTQTMCSLTHAACGTACCSVQPCAQFHTQTVLTNTPIARIFHWNGASASRGSARQDM